MSKRIRKIYTTRPFSNVTPASGKFFEWEEVDGDVITTYRKDSSGTVAAVVTGSTGTSTGGDVSSADPFEAFYYAQIL